MNGIKSFTILLALPVLLFITAESLRNTEGPFYFNAGYDPNYVYAVSSLNIINSVRPVHADHPGSTVQILGAGLMLLSGKSVSEITESVLLNPEYYLLRFNSLLIFLNSICLFLSGLIIFRITKNLILTFIYQLTPFLSQTLIHEFTQTNPEIFIMSMMMLFTALLFSYKNFVTGNNNFSLKYPLLFGIITGVCLASKITFMPILIIPLIILNGLKSKMIFMSVCILTFFTITYPVMGSYKYFFSWIVNLLTHDSLYGKGENIVFNTHYILKNFGDLIINDLLFIIVLFSGILIFLYCRIKNAEKSNKLKTDLMILASLLITFILQIFIVSKHYNQHYLVPVLMLTSFTAIIIFLNIENFILPVQKKLSDKIYNLILIICISVSAYNLVKVFNESGEYFKETVSLKNITDTSGINNILFNSYGSSDYEYGMKFSMNWAGEMKMLYTSILKNNSSGSLSIDFWDHNVTYYDNIDKVKNLLSKSPDILLRLKCFEFNKNAVLDFSKNIKQMSGNEKYNHREIMHCGSGECIYQFSAK